MNIVRFVMNLIAKRTRKKKIEFILKKLPPQKELEKLGEPRKLILLELFGACQRFILGAYDDTVLHSSFALEMTLFIRMDENLSIESKEEIKKKGGLRFAKAIDFAGKKEWFTNKDIEKAWTLHNLRNMFAHPGNWLTLIKETERLALAGLIDAPSNTQEMTTVIQEMPGVLDKLNRIKDTLTQTLKERLGNIPDLEWAAREDTLFFQRRRQKLYYEEILKDTIDKKGLLGLAKHFYNPVAYIRKEYPYTESLGFEALEIAYDLLQKLEIAK